MWFNAARGRTLRASFALLTSAAILAGSAPALASESLNDSSPFTGPGLEIAGDVEVYVSSDTTGFVNATLDIDSSSDVDYVLLVCNAGRKVSQVSLGWLDANINAWVFDTDGTLIHAGDDTFTPPIDHKSFTLSSGVRDNAVVVAVFGEGGATGGYILHFACS